MNHLLAKSPAMEQEVRLTDSVPSCRGVKQGQVFSAFTAHWEAAALGTAGCGEELNDFIASSWHSVKYQLPGSLLQGRVQN